nr:MAG TPA: Tail fiber protein [Caudoviricetes sp.]
MLGANQLDFISYTGAFKNNYRKGVHKLAAILSNPTHAAEFAANLGGVSVVLGVPIGREDRNSDALLSLLLNSDIADDAVLTWMHQFYEFTTWDDLMGNSARVQEMMQNPFLWRALGGSKKAVGKGVATLAGLSCVSYADIDAVVASSTAMAAVAASQTAMTAIVASPTAMAAIWKSNSAVTAVKNNATAWKTFTGATSAVMGKTVAILADLNPADYADMTAVAASQTAMTAVIGNATALNAVVSSSTAMTAVIGNATALNAVVSSSTAMTAVAASSTARAAICASDVAFNHLLSLATYDTISGTTSGSGWSTRYSKPCIALQWCYSYQSGTSGIRTCLDGNASRQYTGSQRYNSSINSSNYNDHEKKPGTYYKEFVFCSKLETYNSQSDWPAISIAYFKLP